MKKILFFIILVVIGILGYLIWNRYFSIPRSVQTQSGKLSECTYNGKKVFSIDNTPSDGGHYLYSASGKEIGFASSGMSLNPTSTIDFSRLQDCRVLRPY